MNIVCHIENPHAVEKFENIFMGFHHHRFKLDFGGRIVFATEIVWLPSNWYAHGVLVV